MMTNPKPCDRISLQETQGSIIIINTNSIDRAGFSDTFEMQSDGMRIFSPFSVSVIGSLLNLKRQTLIASPKLENHLRVHS